MTTELSLLRYIMTKVNIYEKVEESNAALIIKTVKDYYNQSSVYEVLKVKIEENSALYKYSDTH